jgi:subtilase family serine protease
MVRIAIVAALALAVTLTAALPGAADPSIGNVAVQSVTQNGGLNDYHIVGTVTNTCGTSQSRDTLQSVDIYLAGQKLDAKSIPPLAPGQSAQFTYVYQRSKDAGPQTTDLHFVIDTHNGSGANCTAKTASDLIF